MSSRRPRKYVGGGTVTTVGIAGTIAAAGSEVAGVRSTGSLIAGLFAHRASFATLGCHETGAIAARYFVI